MGWKEAQSERTKAGLFYQTHRQIREKVDAIHGHRLHLYTWLRVCVCVCLWVCTLSNSYFNLLRSQLWLCGGLRALEPILGICRQLRAEADWSELVGWFITGPQHWNARCGVWLCLRCSRCDEEVWGGGGGALYWFGVCAHNEVVVQLIWTLVLPGQPPAAAFSTTFGAERTFAGLRRAKRR